MTGPRKDEWILAYSKDLSLGKSMMWSAENKGLQRRKCVWGLWDSHHWMVRRCSVTCAHLILDFHKNRASFAPGFPL